MRGIFRSNAILRTAFVVLAVVALAVLVLVPPGYMIGGGDDASGPVRMIICTGHGPVEAAVDFGKAPPAKNSKESGPCAISAHLSAAPTSAPHIVAAAGQLDSAPIALPASQVAIGRGLAAPPQARAPPVP